MEKKIETTLTLTISLDKDFFEFLRQKGCLEGYVKNVKNQKGNVNRFFESLEREGSDDPGWVVSAAFTWSDSPEGHDFWLGIREEWRKFCFADWWKVKVCKVHWLDTETWEEIFEGTKLLAGKRFCIRDNSWNRPALEKWQDDVWEFYDRDCKTGWQNLVELCSEMCPEEGVLILSDYPVVKTLVNGPSGEDYPEKFVKVLLPDGKPWWVTYSRNCVL